MVEVEVPSMFPLLGKHEQESTVRLEVMHALEASSANVFGFHDGTISIDDVLLEKED